MYTDAAFPWARIGCELSRPGAPDDEYRNALIKKSKSVSLNETRSLTYSAAMRTSGGAERTSASTSFSNLTKFSWNMRTSLRAVPSKAA